MGTEALPASVGDTFVGRAGELGVVRAAIDAAALGAGGVVVVTGEPGVGKTRLVEEALGAARVRESWGRCIEGGVAPAYWPWTQVLRTLVDPATIDGMGPAASDVRLVLGGAGHGVDPDASRFRLFDGVLRALDAASADGPIVVVLDDVQWADEPSLRLLQFLAPELRRRPLLAVVTCRDTEMAATDPLSEVLDDVLRHATAVALGGLPRSETARLVAELTGGGDEPGDDVVDAVCDRAGGNPFFARQLAALVAGGGAIGGRVPLGVQAVVERRLARLPHATQDALSWAAAAGRTFELPAVAAAAGQPPADLLDRLGPAMQGGIVANDEEARFDFVHDIVREALVDSLGPAERAQRHWALGTVLAGTGSSDATATARIAGHLIAGVAVGEPDVACAWAERAARHAASVLAYEEAATWLERALGVLRSTGDARDREIPLRLAHGAARLDAGQLHAAREAYVAAAALARERGDATALAEAALGLGAGLSGFEVALFDDVQLELLDEALASLPPGDSALRSLLLARLSVALAFVDSSDRRGRLAEDAIGMARRAGDDAAVAYALAAWCDAFAGPDDVDGRLQAAGEVIERARAARLRPLELLGRRFRVVALFERGRLAEAEREVDEFARVADRLRQPLYGWYVPFWRATLRMAAGDLQGAARLTDEAQQLGARIGSNNCRTLVAIQRWVHMRYHGRHADAAAFVAWLDDVSDVGAPDSLDGSRLVLDVCRGELDRARQRATRLAAAPLPDKADSEWLPNLAQLAAAAAVLRHEELAALVHDALAPHVDLFVVEGIGAAVVGSVAHYLSLTADLLGRPDAADLAEHAHDLERSAGLAFAPPPMWEPTGPSARGEDATAAVFRREQRVWTITFAGRTVHMPDSKGLRDLAELLGHPGQAVHVTELTGTAPGSTAPTIDRAAAAAYRRRLDDVDAELASAQADHDAERAARLQLERDALLDELRGSVGLGGRTRRAGDPVERARKAVTTRIRDSIRRIDDAHPELGRHLANSVRTGTWCSYQPERRVDWQR